MQTGTWGNFRLARFDRYMLSQLMVLFGFFSLVLVMVYWINRAVVLFGQLIADGQNASVFLEFMALSLPAVIRLALPIAAFAASIYVTNRMINESELIVVQATGFSPFRLARPVLYFGIIVALLMSILMHFLVPLSSGQLSDRSNELAQNVGARLLTEGQFMEPATGVTLYIREITPEGELRDILLSDLRDPRTQFTYTAAQAYLVRIGNDAQLVMVNGLAQTLNTTNSKLFTTAFEDFAYNIGNLITASTNDRRSIRELSTLELLVPNDALMAETNQTMAQLITEGHDRIVQTLLGVVGALVGFAALVVGNHSRFGVWRQILLAIFCIILIKSIETAGLNLARQNATLWPMSYLSTVVGFAIVWVLLVVASRPALLKSRRKVTA